MLILSIRGLHSGFQWPRASGHHNPALDGFTVRRTGDAPTKMRIVMYLEHYPEQFKVLPELGTQFSASITAPTYRGHRKCPWDQGG